MLPTEALAQLATVAAAVDGIREAQYPAKGMTPKYPSLIVLWDGSTMQYQSTEQYWSMAVRGLLLTGATNETKHHVAEVDPLIARLADAFSSGNFDGFTLRRSNGDMVDGCQLVSADASQQITYAGSEHYGAVLQWQIELRRFNS